MNSAPQYLREMKSYTRRHQVQLIYTPTTNHHTLMMLNIESISRGIARIIIFILG